MSVAQILVGEKGCAIYEQLLGVAVGYDPDGRLTIVFAGLKALGPAQIRRLIDELETAANHLLRGQTGPTQ